MTMRQMIGWIAAGSIVTGVNVAIWEHNAPGWVILCTTFGGGGIGFLLGDIAESLHIKSKSAP